MINLENRIERDELIDDYFNKGYACDIREVYQAIVNTIADLEYANDEKSDEIERLNNIINELEKYIIDFKEDYEKNEFQPNAKVYIYWKDLIDKLQELKGSNKE